MSLETNYLNLALLLTARFRDHVYYHLLIGVSGTETKLSMSRRGGNLKKDDDKLVLGLSLIHSNPSIELPTAT